MSSFLDGTPLYSFLSSVLTPLPSYSRSFYQRVGYYRLPASSRAWQLPASAAASYLGRLPATTFGASFTGQCDGSRA